MHASRLSNNDESGLTMEISSQDNIGFQYRSYESRPQNRFSSTSLRCLSVHVMMRQTFGQDYV
eukprot:6190565-Pleurochrysis_carterae.AAC.4